MKQEQYDKAKSIQYQMYLLNECKNQWENRFVEPKDLKNLSRDEINNISVEIFDKFRNDIISDLQNKLDLLNEEFEKI